jgi:GGDEF domain-containing protein
MAGTERKGIFKRLTEALFEDVEAPPAPPPARPAAAAGRLQPTEPTSAASARSSAPLVPNPLPSEDDEDEQVALWETAMATQRQERTAKAQAAFENRLSELTEDQKPGSAGKMSLFGLDDIKAELGDRWESMAERARLVAEQVISRRMAPNDVYAPFDEDSFLILFADLSEEQAAIKLTVIANEVHERLLGEMGLQNRHWVRSFVSEIVVKDGVQPPRTLNEFNLALAGARDLGAPEPTHHRQTPALGVRDNAANAAAARVRLEEQVELTMAAGKSQTAGKMQFLDIERIRAEFGDRWEMVADKAQTIVENVIRARIGPADVMAPYSDDSYLVIFAELNEPRARLKTQAIAREIRERLLGELQLEEGVRAFVAEVPEERPPGNVLEWLNRTVSATLDVAPQKPGKTGDGAAAIRAGEISACYRPTLFAAKSVISIHDCHPLRMDGDGRIQAGVQAYPAKDPAVTFEIDRALLEHGVRDLHAMIKGGKAGVIQVPIHAGSMLAHSNFLLIDLIRSLHPDERKYLVLDLMGIEATGLLSRLPEIVTTLSPFCRAISARVSLDFHDFEALARLGVAFVGSDLEAAASDGIIPRIQRFIASAQRCKQSVFLFGVHDLKALSAYKSFGVAYLNGRAISRATAHPHGVHPWIAPRAPRAAAG